MVNRGELIAQKLTSERLGVRCYGRPLVQIVKNMSSLPFNATVVKDRVVKKTRETRLTASGLVRPRVYRRVLWMRKLTSIATRIDRIDH